MEDRLLTLEEASAVCGLAVRTLQLYIKAGKVKAFKPGGANKIGWRVTATEIIRLVRSRVPDEYQDLAEADAQKKLASLPQAS